MTKRNWLFLIVAVAGFQCFSLRADDLFQLFWRGTYYTHDSSGHIAAVHFTEQTVVNEVANSLGMDPSQLILVYRPNERDVAVVQSNGSFVASVFQMQYTYTDIVNPSGSVIVRHALLGDQSHDTALGSFFGTELRSLDGSGNLVNDSLVGIALYSKSDVGIVYSAHVKTGDRVGQ